MDKYRVPSALTKVIGDRDKAIRFKHDFDLISEYFNKKLVASRKESNSRTTFDVPAWSEQMAHYMGYQKALQEIVDFLTIKEKQN